MNKKWKIIIAISWTIIWITLAIIWFVQPAPDTTDYINWLISNGILLDLLIAGTIFIGIALVFAITDTLWMWAFDMIDENGKIKIKCGE
jgi:hypothetical protein